MSKDQGADLISPSGSHSLPDVPLTKFCCERIKWTLLSVRVRELINNLRLIQQYMRVKEKRGESGLRFLNVLKQAVYHNVPVGSQ